MQVERGFGLAEAWWASDPWRRVIFSANRAWRNRSQFSLLHPNVKNQGSEASGSEASDRTTF